MSATVLRVGFVPLTDCAPLVVAREMGFAAEEGLALELRPAPSWAFLRDLLLQEDIEAAHMLAPVPVALALGLGPWGPGMEALQVLSVNGTVVGVSRGLAAQFSEAGQAFAFGDALGARDAVLAAGPLRVGVPFAFSMHRELLHRWLGDAPDLAIRTVPPPMMAEALAAGDIDMFCVGEPWGSVAVDQGVAELILPGAAIWRFAPEKVLAARTGWAEANADQAGALMRAVWRAGQWLAGAGRRAMAADLLSRDSYLGRSSDVLERALRDELIVSPDGHLRQVSDFINFYDGAATFPWRSQAAWIGARLALRHGLDPAAAMETAKAVFRSDLYRTHLAGTGAAIPSASSRVEGALGAATAVGSAEGRLILSPDAFFDGKSFDPDGHLPIS
ncbi:MAG: CmpA/NrtA family ABC transporter substrate-binding protein [Pseudomonadota bacterium]